MAQYWDIDNQYCTQSRKEGEWEEAQSLLSCLIWFIVEKHPELRGRLRLWSWKEPGGKSEQKFSRYNKESFFFIVSWWNFFNRILVHSPRQLQCQGMVQYSARAVWKMAIKNCQDGLELSKDYFGFAKPSVWLFRAVQHCSCSVLEVCSEQVTGIRSLARSCRGWIAGTEGSAVLLCKAVIKDQILLKVPGFFFIYTSLTTQNHAKCIFITGR